MVSARHHHHNCLCTAGSISKNIRRRPRDCGYTDRIWRRQSFSVTPRTGDRLHCCIVGCRGSAGVDGGSILSGISELTHTAGTSDNRRIRFRARCGGDSELRTVRRQGASPIEVSVLTVITELVLGPDTGEPSVTVSGIRAVSIANVFGRMRIAVYAYPDLKRV